MNFLTREQILALTLDEFQLLTHQQLDKIDRLETEFRQQRTIAASEAHLQAIEELKRIVSTWKPIRQSIN